MVRREEKEKHKKQQVNGKQNREENSFLRVVSRKHSHRAGEKLQRETNKKPVIA
jgi:3'-phosphoadenosine 5'-phosphosulfate (PAPS) 3'-phosphatase